MYDINYSLDHNIIVEIKSVHWENDGIGPYEYWGAKGIDKGNDCISEIEISKFTIKKGDENIEILPDQKEVFQFLFELIADNEDFIDAVILKEEEQIEADKLESTIERQESNKYYGENSI